MSAYPEKIWQLFREARRAGRFEQEEGVVTGRATTPASHAVLQLYLLAPDGERIQEARFQALGCPYLVATGSWLCGYLTGRKLSAAGELPAAKVAEQMALPAVKRYCAVMASQALKNAVENAGKPAQKSTVKS